MSAPEVTELNTPLYQRVGEKLYQLNLETTAAQVRTADGGDMETKLSSLSAAVAGQTVMTVVDDLAARDALAGMKTGDQVWVRDASADPTVAAGAAKYLYEGAGAGWVKTAEAESMDVTLTWANLRDRPNAAVPEIDDAVDKKHAHANKTDVLDKLSARDGELLFDGRRINDGMVDVASTASLDAIPDNLRDGGLLIVNAAGA